MRAMGRKGLGSVIGEELRLRLDYPLIFKTLIADLGHGYDATIVIDIKTYAVVMTIFDWIVCVVLIGVIVWLILVRTKE